MTQEIFENLVLSYTQIEDPLNIGSSVLKILGITYKEGIFYCTGIGEINPTKFKSSSKWLTTKKSNKITPLTLSYFDVQCIEDVLNKYEFKFIINLSPLFECIGWNVTDTSGKIKIHFVGSATYDLWKEGDTDWKHPYGSYDDFNPLEIVGVENDWDWRNGTGWPDGIDINKTKPNWKEDLDG